MLCEPQAHSIARGQTKLLKQAKYELCQHWSEDKQMVRIDFKELELKVSDVPVAKLNQNKIQIQWHIDRYKDTNVEAAKKAAASVTVKA